MSQRSINSLRDSQKLLSVKSVTFSSILTPLKPFSYLWLLHTLPSSSSNPAVTYLYRLRGLLRTSYRGCRHHSKLGSQSRMASLSTTVSKRRFISGSIFILLITSSCHSPSQLSRITWNHHIYLQSLSLKITRLCNQTHPTHHAIPAPLGQFAQIYAGWD